MELTLFEKLRLKLINSLVTKKPESTFLTEKPKLKKVKAYDDSLDFNSQSNHIFNQLKNL